MEEVSSNTIHYALAKDALQTSLAIIGVWIAASGLNTWKKQIKGSKEMNAAHDLHLSTLKLREAIKHVRNPWRWPSEDERAIKFLKEKYPGKSDEELKKDAESGVYEVRWQQITDAYANAEAHLLLGEVLWGTEIPTLFKPLTKKIQELNLALNQYFSPKDLRVKDLSELREVIYDGSREDHLDVFMRDVDLAIKDLETYLKRKLG
jgi:hypothetical protein